MFFFLFLLCVCLNNISGSDRQTHPHISIDFNWAQLTVIDLYWLGPIKITNEYSKLKTEFYENLLIETENRIPNRMFIVNSYCINNKHNANVQCKADL